MYGRKIRAVLVKPSSILMPKNLLAHIGPASRRASFPPCIDLSRSGLAPCPDSQASTKRSPEAHCTDDEVLVPLSRLSRGSKHLSGNDRALDYAHLLQAAMLSCKREV